MATTIKDSVYKAIDVIVGKRIEDLHLDKTIEATVDKCLNLSTGKYRLKYGSGIFDAYANADEIYMPNTAVYVLVPENDFNKKKTIIGRANTGSQTNKQEEQSVASMYNGYSTIGQNILVPANKNKFGLASYANQEKEDSIILYSASRPNSENLIYINNEKLKVYLEEAKGFLFSGKFKTKFANQQIFSTQGDYGLRFNLILKNGKTSFPNMQARWEAEEPNTICLVNEKNISLQTYKDKIDSIIYSDEYDITVKEIQKRLSTELATLQNFAAQLDFVDASTLELVNLYIQLVNELTIYTVNLQNEPITIEELQYQYEQWFTSSSYAFQEESWTVELNTNKMVGNPYYYNEPSYQYLFVEVNSDTFVRIDSIELYYKNFPYNLELTSSYGNDIQVEDVSITCIKYLDNTNGDYRLDIEYEDIYFDATANDQDVVNITAKLIYQNKTDVTSYSSIMWFKKNDNIVPGSIGYSMYAGNGWEHITSINGKATYDKIPTLTLTAAENLAYRNKYKVVAMYESSTIVQQEFIIYNDKHKHDIILVSDSGTSFGAGAGKKRITCVIDGNSIVSSNYNFKWYKELEDGTRYQIQDEDGIKDLEAIIADKNTNLNIKSSTKVELNSISDIEWTDNNNYIIVNSTAVPNNSKVKIICIISSIIDNTEIMLDEVEITLDSGYSVNLKNYYIEIVNGNQVFQYNEAGISPSSDIYEDPQIPQPLTCNFYDPSGGLINPLRYKVSWEIPIDNTLIYVDKSSLTYNGVTDINNILKTDNCIFTIKNEYNYNSTNNQIICVVEFNDGDGLVTYRQSTNFFFGKIGDDGTNGTDVVSKITVVTNDHPNLQSNYNNNTLLKELLTLKIEPKNKIENNFFWNNGLTMDDAILQLELFKKNSLVKNTDYRKVNWSVLSNGLTSKYWSTQNISDETTGAKKAVVFYDEEKNQKGYTNYIIKAQADLPIDDEKYQTYYNFYPICVDKKYQVDTHRYSYNEYNEEGQSTQKIKTVQNNYNIGIDRARTLRQVVYNSDGRNPLYDKNLGVGLTFKNLDYPRTIVWEPHGGVILEDKKDEVFPAFTLGKTKSYVAAYDKEIDEILNDLEFNKKQEIASIQQAQRNNVIEIIKTNINNIKTNLENQKTDNYNNQIKLQNTLTLAWTNFTSERIDAVQIMYDKLIALIRDNTPVKVWKIEDYLYNNEEEKIFNNEGDFKQTIENYLENRCAFDNFLNNERTDRYSLDMLKINSLNLKVSDIEDENIQESIEKNFATLKDLLLSGYETYKIIFYRRNQDNMNNYNDLGSLIIQLNQQIAKYDEIVKTIDNHNYEEIIKDIVFEGSLEYTRLGNDLLLSVVLSVKQQFENELIDITDKYDTQIAFLTGVITDDTDPTYCSIIPNAVYNGEYPNQYVKVKIYQGLVDNIDNNSILEHELIIPFHMSLNTYGLASLNAWDGSSVEINEDEGYVLAPQIGAGIKHIEDNTFTGVLMGTEKTFDDAAGQEEIGLLGYSHGKRSIFLDAATGNATFGLPETDAADASNPLTEGRIELRPGGTSSISKWNFDARSLYRIVSEDETEAIMKTRTYTKQYSDSSLGAPYEDAPQYAHGSIPHKKQGILLSALPAYASFKGRILTEEDHDEQRVNYLNLNTSVREGDTFELQIDPNDSRFFSLYEHSTRIYEGYGTCDTLNGYQEANKYPLTEEEFEQYFNIFINTSADNYYSIDADNTIILTQRYLRLNSNRELRQVFRPLSYLYQNSNGDYYWKIINPAVDKKEQEVNEYVIATLKQYTDWQNNNRKQTAWKYITFKTLDERKPEDVKLISVVNDDEQLIELSVANNDIINDNTEVWHRYKKAGIDATGKFVAEGIGTGTLGMGLNDIQAFNVGSLFVGANFESNNGTIVQFFVDKLSTDATSPLFISSTKTLSNPSIEDTSNDDEGRRPVRIYAGRDYEDLNTGIFVGQTVEKNPTNKIAKIELSQTSAHNNKIILSALGEDIESNASVLSLISSDETDQEGSLIHTGNWTTHIGKKMTIFAGEATTFTGTELSSILTNNFSMVANNTNNKITTSNSNISLINQTNNQFILSNTSNFKAKQKINISSGVGNTSAITGPSVLIDAAYTNGGLILRAFNSNIDTKTINGNNIVNRNGAVLFQMQPTGVGVFKLQTGQSYINSYYISTSGEAGVNVGTNLIVGNSGQGKIKGDGTNISNTARGYNTRNNSKTPDYTYDNEYSPALGGSFSFYISRVEGFGSATKAQDEKNGTYGRPHFKTEKITVNIPDVNLTGYAKTADIKKWANGKFLTSATGASLSVSRDWVSIKIGSSSAKVYSTSQVDNKITALYNKIMAEIKK